MSQSQSIAQKFLAQFYGDAVSKEARFALWTKHNRAHAWLGGVDFVDSKIDAKKDTYFTMGLYPRGITKRTQDNVLGIRGVWLDVDCGDKQTGQKYFPTPEDALDWVTDELTGMWSYIIHSGGGLHVYLMFDETLWIETDEDRIFAKKLVKAYHRWASSRCPYDIDSLIDLSRIMRLPGTAHTGNNALCHVADESGVEIAASDLFEKLPEVELDETSHLSEIDGEVDLDELKTKLQMVKEQDNTFDLTWKRQRRITDKSPSGYCLSIANQMVMAGFKDGEIVAALKIWRQSQTDGKEKPDEWYLRTVAKARSASKDDILGQRVEDAVQDDNTDIKMTQLSAVFGREFIGITKRVTPEYKGRAEKCVYKVELEGCSFMVPSTSVLLNQNQMKAIAFEDATVVMAYLKPAKWNNFLQLLLQVMETVEEEVEGNLAYNIEQELKSFIRKKSENMHAVDDLSAWDPMKILVEGDMVYFAWPTFKMHLASGGYNVSNKELASLLKGLGCSSRQFSDRARTRLWCAPKGE
jgi:hypothetical protein